MLYWAYGSNSHLSALRNYLVRHEVSPKDISNPRRAILDDYRIRTNYLRDGRTGAANVEPALGHRVEGLLLDISSDVHRVLRRKEGFPHRYCEVNIFVHLPRSRRLIMAMTYIVTQECRLPTDMPVHQTYRQTLLEGAHQAGFTKKYQRHLSTLLRTA